MDVQDPLFGYQGQKLKEYIEQKPLKVGNQMMIYGSQGMQHSYELTTVEDINVGPQKRLVVSKPGPWGGRSFYRTGKNCFSPKGQSRLLPVIDWVKEKMGERQSIIFSWDWKTSL